MCHVQEIFGSMVFGDAAMKERLSKDVYERLCQTIRLGKHLDLDLANDVAAAMKDWAIEKGATHFTHWFQPMTGITAEKHDSFIRPTEDGKIIMEFSGKELIRGESDASSFPSGGLRATFEARGYTAWDPTSYAFIKGNTLCIPTAFCSFGGEALDNKTPLLRSMECINRQALRVLRLFGNEDVKSVRTTVGPEQEYFLIDETLFDKRPDLIFTGRTLFGAKAPKGQELDDHYYGCIKPRIADFMAEVDEELWKLGVLAKTEHNEAAPAQHELAPIFTTANIAADHNQLTMEIIRNTARKHGMVCLLHEKPFAGVNGSGKHNNWSLSTDTGINLLEPGNTPYENAQFLLFLCAVIRAVDEYQDLMRVSVASAGNDHRLGANEAPPAVVSIFLGDELTAIMDAIDKGNGYDAKEKELMRVGVHILPKFPKDNTDRNRTSPFAFTGNKFEFRMLGSSASISDANLVLNTAVAQILKEFADKLEGCENFESSLHELIRSTYHDHRRILFNGNGYDDAWIKEAEKRGLCNYPTTPDCLPCFLKEKNVRLFAENKILSESEIKARYEVMVSNYVKLVHIEAVTAVAMVKKEILPAVIRYTRDLADAALTKKAVAADVNTETEEGTLRALSSLAGSAYGKLAVLEEKIKTAENMKNSSDASRFYSESVLPALESLRYNVDEMETMTEKSYWPFPAYSDLLFGIH